MRRVGLMLCFVFACHRENAPDAGHDDASIPGELDTGVDTSGPLLGEVAIATWNIETFPKTATTAHLVREVILSLSPDLIGIEEIAEPADFTALIADLPGYDGVQVYTRDFIRVGLLYRTERIQVANIEKLFERDYVNFPRSPLKVDVTVTSSGAEIFDFTFIVVHHKALGDTESRERRRGANVALDAWIRARMTETDERDYIVVGDFNDRLEDRPGENVFEVFLDQPELYFFLTKSLAETGEVSYIPFPGLIDHLLITTDALYEYGDGATQVLHLDDTIPGYEALISDHRPVFSRFKIHEM